MNTEKLTDPVTGAQATVALDTRLVIRLQENPTTGFRWSCDLSNEGVLESLGDEYSASGVGRGAGGYREFSFRGSLPGTVGMSFVLRRAWQSDVAEKTLIISAVVASTQ